MKKVAFVFRGGVSKRSGSTYRSDGKYEPEEMKYRYINFLSVEKGLRRNLVENNPGYQIDFYIHSWNTDLQEDLDKLYLPKLSKYELNSNYYDELNKLLDKCQSGHLSTASQYLSLRKGIELVEQSGINYDLIVSWRLDVLLYGKMDLDTYDENYFYINHDPIGTKDLDMHFVTGFKNKDLLKNIYSAIDKDCIPKPHGIIVNYFNKIGKPELLKTDQVVYRRDNEMVRALIWCYKNYQISSEQLALYGLTVEDIQAAVP